MIAPPVFAPLSYIFCLFLLLPIHKISLLFLPHFIFVSPTPVSFMFYLLTFCFNNPEISPTQVSQLSTSV